MESSVGSTLTGLAACTISVLFFGTMFVPVKKFTTGDGLFVQWVMSIAILVVGLIVNAIEGFPPFFPLAMLGGVFWSIGNVTAVPIINTLGMGLGVLIWGTTNCLLGWASSRFGLFGLIARPPNNQILNYFGLVLVLIGGAIFSFVEARPNKPNDDRSGEIERESLLGSAASDDIGLYQVDDEVIRVSKHRRICGVLLALAAGVFYGITFDPVIYIQDHASEYPGATNHGLAYVLSHYSGVFLTSTAFFIIYAVYKQNRPFISAQTALPAYISGTLWAIAQSSWFVANENLSQTVTFPIISMVPGVIASLWSVIYFREIRGNRNLRMLAIAIGITLTGAVLVGLSK